MRGEGRAQSTSRAAGCRIEPGFDLGDRVLIRVRSQVLNPPNGSAAFDPNRVEQLPLCQAFARVLAGRQLHQTDRAQATHWCNVSSAYIPPRFRGI
jgi:hypothetical protein